MKREFDLLALEEAAAFGVRGVLTALVVSLLPR